MIVGTWNVNHRAGKTRFRPEAADAVAAIGADILVITEFFPRNAEAVFREVVAAAGWCHQLASGDPDGRANRVLIASRVPLEAIDPRAPAIDEHLPSNVIAARIPDADVLLIGLRVPWYRDAASRAKVWNWIETRASELSSLPSLLIGDFNVPRESLSVRRILDAGWTLADVRDATFFGHRGTTSTIDHIFATPDLRMTEARAITHAGPFDLAGSRTALSDHAVVTCSVTRKTPRQVSTQGP